MKKSRTIFTSAFLASVMALSLTLTAVADGTNASEALTENGSEISVSLTESDEMPVYEDSAEAAEPRYAETYVYLDEKEIQTFGGTAGHVTVKFGIYKRYFEFGGGHAEMNYGVSAKIIDSSSSSDGRDLKANFTITIEGEERENIYPVEANAYSNQLYYDFPTGYNFVSIEAHLTFKSDAFGDIIDEILVAAC